MSECPCERQILLPGSDFVQHDVPLCVDGVTVVPGDYVFAHGSAEAILKKGRKILAKMDRVNEPFVNENTQTLLRKGSSQL